LVTQTVRDATRDDVGELARVLARSFQRDPVHRWLFPDDAAWVRGSAAFWALLIRRALKQGVVLTTAGLAGVALWWPPNAAHEGFVEGLLFSARMLLVLRRSVARGIRVGRALESHHPAQPHWYLGVLGTAPEHQGKGVSTAVMEPILRRCDATHVLAYLESSNVVNIPLYERRGFRVIGEIVMPAGPTIWPMLRQPRG
jgi:ribosomal protein S18 acetylase RimI-like enzyme